MKRIKRSSYALLLVLGLIAALAISPIAASAASAYDNYYASTDRLELLNAGCTVETRAADVAFSWRQYIKASSFGSSFDTALHSGSYGVSFLPRYGMSGNTVTDKAVIVYWSENSQMSIDWMGWGYMVAHTPTHAAIMQLGGTTSNICSVMVANYGTGYISSNDGAVMNYFFTGDVTYPTGYEGSAIVGTQPPAKHVALGDSFTSGKGNGSYEAGTDEDGVNECQRSAQAYPRLVQSDLNLYPTAFVACSGATTANVLYGGASDGAWGEPPQVDALSSSTEKVTITIGGNDVGFVYYLISCVVVCGPGTPFYDAMMDGINDDFKSNLKTTYETILTKAPTAEVYVLDYPYMSAEDAVTCGPFDFSGARNVQVKLNTTIMSAVTEVGNARLHYVPTNYAGSPFTDKHLCTDDPAGSDFDLLTMHPNTQGQQDYATVAEAAIA